MKAEEVARLIDGVVLSGKNLLDKVEVKTAFAADLMSDVLTLDSNNLLLITGLSNIQIIRTSEILDIKAILLVRNKKPDNEMIELARQNNIALISSPLSMFHACGILYKEGLKPLF